MVGAPRTPWLALAFASAGVVTVIAVALSLRLDDPLSSPVLAAEDPFTHMALVREHLLDGEIEPLNKGGDLYPPGMHAFLAASWVYTGVDLYELIRFGPAFLGAIGVVGIAVVLGRHEGPVAALVGSLAFAIAPEAVFRTSMMAPTALDLAILPVFLYAVLEVYGGRLRWAWVVAVLAAFLVFAHPWLLTLLSLIGIAFAVGALALRWTSARGATPSPRGLVALVAVLGLAWGLALTGCDGFCGDGFSRKFAGGERFGIFALPILGLGIVAAAALRFAPRVLDRLAPRPEPRPLPILLRGLASAALAAFVVGLLALATQRGLPEFVNLPKMFGWPILLLAAAGFVALPFLPGPAAWAGAATALVTYPFVIFNPLDSPFWPHRTAVFLGVGLVILAGSAAGAAVRLLAGLVAARQSRTSTPRPRVAGPAFALVSVALVGAPLAGAVYLGTPNDPPHWYRLYDECEFGHLREISDRAAQEPKALVITGAWQSKLVLAALTEDASRVWYWAGFFAAKPDRGRFVEDSVRAGRSLYVVVDEYLLEKKGQDLGFLSQAPWQEFGAWCGPHAGAPHSLVVYVAPGGAR